MLEKLKANMKESPTKGNMWQKLSKTISQSNENTSFKTAQKPKDLSFKLIEMEESATKTEKL